MVPLFLSLSAPALLLLLLLSFTSPSLPSPPPPVTLPYGQVEGIPCSSNPDVIQYLGIPFAEPPIGDQRFRTSVPYNRTFSGGLYSANKAPPQCPQIQFGATLDGDMSEDCLYLNIWVPTPPPSSPPLSLSSRSPRLPVRVFIHGGAWTMLSASVSFFNGCTSAQGGGSIIVNIQYRLGILGFLAHPQTYSESNSTGNWGIHDQQLALKWVKENIGRFGGDHQKIALSGQSAGAWAVALHVSLPSSGGLFSAAISESVPGWDFSTMEQAYAETWDLMEKIGCSLTNPYERQLACLRNATSADLLDAMPLSSLLYLSEPQYQIFSPVIDKTFLKKQIKKSFEDGTFNKVPYLIGSNKDEGLLAVGLAYPDVLAVQTSDIVDFLLTAYPSINYTNVLKEYPESSFQDYPAPIFRRLVQIWTDVYFSCPLDKAVRLLAKKQIPVFRYFMSHIPTCPTSAGGELAGAGVAHNDQEQYVFNITVDEAGCAFTDADKLLANSMVHAWANMARLGYPITDNGEPWATWNPLEQETMILDLPLTSQKIDFQERCYLYPDSFGEPNAKLQKLEQKTNDSREIQEM